MRINHEYLQWKLVNLQYKGYVVIMLDVVYN